ncbi:MAG: DUF1284 domain-containing protein [Oscillospiraceae bacterium]|nr:DUF1284 domain-containing protein [Oscillospiraceae bacterium]
MKLRPHHLLCIGFFEGKGYSPAFVQHMTRIIAYLEQTAPPVTLTCACDVICQACPHCRDGICETAEKVLRYDKAVLSCCGLQEGDTLPYPLLREHVAAEILAKHRLSGVCGDCSWFSVCRQYKK